MVSEQIMQVVNEIALKLGVAAEKVYPMLIKQAEAKVMLYHTTLWITGIALVLFVVAICLFFAEKTEALGFGMMIVLGIILVIAGLEAAFELQDFITAKVNPEWYAIEYVLDLIK